MRRLTAYKMILINMVGEVGVEPTFSFSTLPYLDSAYFCLLVYKTSSKTDISNSPIIKIFIDGY